VSSDGTRCDGGFVVDGGCMQGCWIPDAGCIMPVSSLFDDPLFGWGCTGCHPEISDVGLSAVAEGTACGLGPFSGVCATQGGATPNWCACQAAGAQCPLWSVNAEMDASFVIPCCGKCVEGVCCNVSSIVFDDCGTDAPCCDNGTCVSPGPGQPLYCSWDGGGSACTSQ
jgi:hypothetical protein